MKERVMTSGRVGGLKNREPLKADSTGGHLKVAFHRVPGPGARTLRPKTMRHLLFHGAGGPTVRIPEEGFLSLEGRPVDKTRLRADRPIGPPHPAEAGRSLQEEGQPGRCFLRTSSLPPGHDPGIPEMSNFNNHPGIAGGLPKGN